MFKMKIQVIFLLVCCFATAYSLKCYVCQGSEAYEDCVHFKEGSVVATLDCSQVKYDGIFPEGFLPETLSYKYSVLTQDIQKDAKRAVEHYCFKSGVGTEAIRSCVLANKDMLNKVCDKLERSSSGGKSFYCDYCKGDLCNSSSGLVPSVLSLALLALYQIGQRI